ncbi:ABC transporter substrate-binding protein [Roseobacter sinensis]|uniref:ABC transporter substrate-binding protein n=1 Tax=Roseobacter sinensis TaxID=2931391 RepID=A0ABT3BDC5_9RHOB|nr:ABC transporter substrate-binding protein [Roseobacter sp. WL0113]MCV3271550.1 ABC transporter substrate-binding protein [Roseobacter sp. WL0113]
MRHACLALLLSLAASLAHAFELEESRRYPAPGSAELRILSTADADVFEPIIEAFQALYPIAITYDVASSAQVMVALYEEGAHYDLAISSAMDLQTKLANDGFAQRYSSDATAALPSWAKWRDRVFAFTQEPAVLVLNAEAFETLEVPTNREGLIALLRDHPDVFGGRIGTYDVRISGAGYLFATQDSRNTESFWRLTEVMGRLGTRLYCCSAEMIDAVARGELALAYNVLGSYARARLPNTPGIVIVEMDDFVSVMLRTALIPQTAQAPEAAGQMIDFLAGLRLRPDLLAATGLPPVVSGAGADESVIRPIRLGPGLLVFLDRLRRDTFLRSWVSSIEQE